MTYAEFIDYLDLLKTQAKETHGIDWDYSKFKPVLDTHKTAEFYNSLLDIPNSLGISYSTNPINTIEKHSYIIDENFNRLKQVHNDIKDKQKCGCGSLCQAKCTGKCVNACTGNCGGCTSSCGNTCKDSCATTCTGCKAACAHGCTTNCTSGCSTACTGSRS